jgi:endo-1,4-beta-xylanase
LETAGFADQWANLQGSEQAYRGAREVYKFLGVEQKIGIAWRPGKHEQNLIDWTALLDFSDWQMFGKAPGRSFDTLAFPESPPAYSWKAP